MVEIVKPHSNGHERETLPKVCPLSWTPMQAHVEGLVQQPQMQLIAGNCAGARCGFWSGEHERCGVAALPDVLERMRELSGTLSDERAADAGAVSAELRALRGAVLGVYAAAAQVLPGVWPDADEAARDGDAAADEQDAARAKREARGGGETPGEPG